MSPPGSTAAYAAIQALAGAVMAVIGIALLSLGGFLSLLGLVLVVLGAVALGHAIAIACGWLAPPGP
jgi:hypothetical protein